MVNEAAYRGTLHYLPSTWSFGTFYWTYCCPDVSFCFKELKGQMCTAQQQEGTKCFCTDVWLNRMCEISVFLTAHDKVIIIYIDIYLFKMCKDFFLYIRWSFLGFPFSCSSFWIVNQSLHEDILLLLKCTFPPLCTDRQNLLERKCKYRL